jgi:predicted chitinase
MDQMKQFGWNSMTQGQLNDLNRALTTYHIDTPARIQQFLAQTSTESAKGRYTTELASGSEY